LKYGPGKVFYKAEKPAFSTGGYECMREFFKLRFEPDRSDFDVTGGPKERMVEALFVVRVDAYSIFSVEHLKSNI
jgi:hypothetical protein